MAIFHHHTQVIGKSSGRSAVAAAAYRSGSKLVEHIVDIDTGLTTEQVWDYSKKQGVVFSNIYAPENAPEWVYDREKLWNKVTHGETRKDGQLAREFDIALPVELTREQNQDLMEEIVKECYVKYGMVADANLHLDNPKNPHFHVMLSMRDLVEKDNGMVEFGLKNREWNSKSFIVQTREKEAEIINKHLEFYGHLSRVSHLSHKDRGIDLIPTIHVGVAHHINGTERRQLNSEIIAENAKRISENPELVFDKLSINNPVFTKEEIAIALHEVLTNVRGSDGKVVGNEKEVIIDEAIKDEIKELVKGDNWREIKDEIGLGSTLEEVSENQKIASEFMISYSKLMNSEKISLVVEKDLKGRTLYGLTKRIELEKRFTQIVDKLKHSSKHVLNISELELEKPRSLLGGEEKANLSKEQKAVILEILSAPDIAVLQGLPGAGKTHVMKEVVRQYQQAGKIVLGLATSENAAVNLGSVAGIEAMNIDRFRKNNQEQAGKEFKLALKMDFEAEEQYRHAKSVVTDKHVLIVDEASMIELTRSHYLNLIAEQAGAKIIKLGDLNQFAPVGSAGAFKKECQVLKVSHLTEVRRQQNPEHVKATRLLAQYDIEGFLKIYDQEGSIKAFAGEREAIGALVQDYIDNYLEKANALDKDDLVAAGDKVITICAHTNKAVNELNSLVREQLKQAGVIKGHECEVWLGDKKLTLARGEQIIFGQNSKKLGVLNGEIGTVLKVKEKDSEGNAIITVRVSKADGSTCKVKIDTREKYNYTAINYGYAVTAYKLQGTTVDKNFVYYQPNVGYEGINVMMTRHRDTVRLYASKEELENEVYSRVEEDPEIARDLHEIHSRQNLWKIGISLSMHKRSNLSLVGDYARMGLSREDQVLKAYIEARTDFGKLIREIISWQEKQLKICGTKPAVWDHKDWHEAMLYKEERDSRAEVICNNYPKYQDRIIQLNLNYQTIKKHAGISDNYRVRKLDQPSMLSNINYVNLIQILQQLSKIEESTMLGFSKVKVAETTGVENKEGVTGTEVEQVSKPVVKAFYELREEIQERRVMVEALEMQIADISTKRYLIEDQITHTERFISQLFPEYLSRIYKALPAETLGKWGELVKELGIKEAAKLVQNSPRKLGSLRGIGLGSLIGFTNKRIDAIANLAEIGVRFEEYHNGESKIAELRELLANDLNLVGENNLIEQQRQMSLLLPNHYEEKLLKQLELAIAGNISQESGAFTPTMLANLHQIAVSEFVQDEILAIYGRSTKLNENAMDPNSIIADGIDQEKIITDKIVKVTGVKLQQRTSELSRVDKTIEDNKGNRELGVAHDSKQDNRQDNEQMARARSPISFSNIKQNLNSDDYQQIFTTYATSINPDGLVRKQGNNMMCGSLSMSLQSGLWMRHSSGDKGDIFHFVAVAMGKTKRQALKQLADDLGFKSQDGKLVRSREEVKTITADVVGDNKDKANDLAAQWVAMKAVPDNVSFKAKKDFGYLLSSNNLIASYEYRNKDNQIIGYTLRLEDKASGKKQVLPVSYCYNQNLNKSGWRLKGFTDDMDQKPIYGAEKLAVSNKAVLIVEGEKTATKAQSLLPEYTVISWLGGSKAAVNVNWQLLTNKDVVIWPDNDSPGFAAAKAIQQQLNVIASSCMIVDPRVLSLPEKWDLGDASNQDIKIIRNALVSSYNLESIKIVDEQIKALDHQNLSNDQLISLLEKEVVTKLRLDGKANEQYLTRMQEELKVISRAGFGTDFAVAANIARYCQQMNIPIGPGRGSSVSSLVAYGLNIHQIDPVENNLLFERFLTSNSVSNPDFDFDIAASKKVLLENYLLAKYSNASKLSVIGNKKDQARTIHPSGIGIVPGHLQGQLPYSKISNRFWEERNLLEIDHKQAEGLGVKKFDLLSSQVIEGIEKVESLVANCKGKVIDWQKIGWRDSKSFALIKTANTDGIYQLGSNFAKEVVPQVKLEKFEDLVNLLALIRPGSKNYIKYFTDSNKAQKRFSGFSDPKNIFKDTKGIILFQEQVMQAASSYLGMDKSETNQFRKELEKDSSNHPLVDKVNFSRAAITQGLNRQDAANLYDIMKEFSKFGYNKSHALAYARVSFKTAYLKAHYPEQFEEIFKSKDQVVTKEQIVINAPKGIEELTKSRTDDQATYNAVGQNNHLDTALGTEEQIIIPKADAKIGLIEVSAGAYPHRDITILADDLDQALAIKQAGISARILCMRGTDSLKNYQAKSNERVLLVANNGGKLSESSELIAKTIEDLETKGVIVSYLCPQIQRDFNDTVQRHDIVGSLKIYKSFKPVIESLQAKTIDEFLSIKGEAYLDERARQDLTVIKQYAVNEDKILQGFLREYDKGIDSIQKIKSDIAAAEKLIEKHHHIVEEIKKFDDKSNHFSIVGSLVNSSTQGGDDIAALHDMRNKALTNHVNDKLGEYVQQITKARTSIDILHIHQQKQNFLMNLLGGSTYYPDNNSVHQSFKEAKVLAEAQVIKKLVETVEDIQKHKLLPNQEVADMLKQSTDLTKIYHNLSRKREEYHVTSNLAKLVKAKQEAKTVQVALKALEKEQEYLASLHGKIKDPYYKGSSLAQSVKYAYRNNKDNIITQLHKLTAYLDRPSVKQEHIVTTIKKASNSRDALHSLTKQYHKHVISELKSCLEHIYDRKELKLDGHKFTKPLQLMDYVLKKHEHNEFFPREHIQNGRNNYAQYQKEISKSKEFGGPSL